MHRDSLHWLLLPAGLGLAAAGQFYFARKPNYAWDGVVFYVVGALLFLAATRPAIRAEEKRPEAFRLSPDMLVRSLSVAAGLLLGFLAVLQLTEPRDNYWPVFWSWVAGCLPFLSGFARKPEWSWVARQRGGAAGEREEDAVSAAEAVGLATGQETVTPARGEPSTHRYWVSRRSPASGGSPQLPVGGVLPELSAVAGLELPAGGVAAAATYARGSRVAMAARLRNPVAAVPVEWLWTAGVLAVTLALRVWRLDSVPWTLSGDEGNFGLFARGVLAGRVPNMFVTGHLSMPTMYSYFQAAWLKLAGDDILGLRLPWAILGTFGVLGAYLLVRRLFGRWMALLTAFLLATYHYHIHYSRLGINNISDPLFLSWSLYFLVLALQANRRWAWAASGMVAGLAFYSYTGSRLVPIVLAAAIFWAVLSESQFLRNHSKDLVVMVLGFLVVVGPMALFAVQHPDDFNARLNQIGIIQSGWLDNEVATIGHSRWYILADQLQRALLAFNFYRDRSDFYNPGISLMDFGMAIFFVLGAAVAVSRLSRSADAPRPGDVVGETVLAGWRYAIFVLWFVLAIGIGGALTESPPSSQRLVASIVPAVLFVALAVREISALLCQALEWSSTRSRVVAGGLALALAFTSVRFYFVTYQQSWAYGSFNAEVATRIGYYLRDLAAEDSGNRSPAAPRVEEYFFGAPRMYADFGSIPFIAQGVPLHDVITPLDGPPAFQPTAALPVFVFLPERAGELKWVQQAFPNGTVEEVHRLDQAEAPLLFIAYRVN